MNKQRFVSKNEALSSLYLWVTIPVASVFLGIYAISRASRAYPLTNEVITRGYYVAFIQAAVIGTYACYKIIQALKSIYRDDFNNLPETSTMICVKCMEPAILDEATGMICKKCGGTLEEVRGFYDRHPELNK